MRIHTASSISPGCACRSSRPRTSMASFPAAHRRRTFSFVVTSPGQGTECSVSVLPLVCQIHGTRIHNQVTVEIDVRGTLLGQEESERVAALRKMSLEPPPEGRLDVFNLLRQYDER